VDRWGLLRQWPQALLAALLTPAWLAGEWIVATEHRHGEVVLSVGLLLLALTYLGAEPSVRHGGGAVRARLPRGWARTAPYDPSLPIRGRYVRLRLQVPVAGSLGETGPGDIRGVRLRETKGRLVAEIDDNQLRATARLQPGDRSALLTEPVAYFIPEHAADPSVRPADEQLWAEVTVPRRGPPRPIRLGVWKDGRLTPLDLR
jgi:hypothetical protein